METNEQALKRAKRRYKQLREGKHFYDKAELLVALDNAWSDIARIRQAMWIEHLNKLSRN